MEIGLYMSTCILNDESMPCILEPACVYKHGLSYHQNYQEKWKIEQKVVSKVDIEKYLCLFGLSTQDHVKRFGVLATYD